MPVAVRTFAAPLALLAALAAAPAAHAARIYDVPGVGGRSVSVAAAARLDNGGAVVAATVRHGSARRLVVVRLLASGEPDRSYGGFDGVVPVPSVTRGTAVAVDSRTGAAWVGGRAGRRGAVVALDPSGRRSRNFAPRPFAAGAPTALALHGRRLVAAVPLGPCRGCRVQALNARTGQQLEAHAGAPVPTGDLGFCGNHVEVASLAPFGSSWLLGGSGGSCPTRLSIVPTGRPAADAHTLSLGPGATRTAVAPASGSLSTCIAVERGRSVGLARVAPRDLPGGDATAQPPPANLPVASIRRSGRTLVAVAPVGDRACAALLRGRHGTVIAQAAEREAAITVRRVPRSLHATALFFCRRHVNVLGAHGRRLGLLALPARH